ncbi:MAG: beta-glucuronidase [Dictyoglomaceae bacterium]|nr:beta-glucuronidase [Dictyoglomaceae bacterium]HPU44035.1 beta-glucuronidase [Dictyoglomaceae bacterium]
MLYPIDSETRETKDLSGIWEFRINEKGDPILMPVPASYNDVTQDPKIRDHVGKVWYKTKFFIPYYWKEKRVFIRVGSATHYAEVFINSEKVVEHKGGFLPFETEISEVLKFGSENEVIIVADNTLTWDTLPPGELKIKEDPIHSKILDYHFDFFNYSGIHRPVILYTTPKDYIQDIKIVTEIDGKKGIVSYEVKSINNNVAVTLRDKEGNKVAFNKGEKGVLEVEDAKLWEPGNPYLYTLETKVYDNDEPIDSYRVNIGIRTVKVDGKRFLINEKPFYFKGFGKHEDADIRGKGLDHVINIKDFNLLKWIGANSFRTSHYPYSEEILFLADRYGIAVIEEVPAVGMNLWNPHEKVFTDGRVDSKTLEHHLQVIRGLIERDKNHPSVVMWSVANEAATYEEGAEEYFKKVTDETRKLDSTRPITIVESASYSETKVSQYVDVVCINRYYSWYTDSGNLDVIYPQLRQELKDWYNKFKKPIILSEFGADAILGFHQDPPVMFTEEYQWEMIRRFQEVLDEFDFVIGEHIWNFADFMTKQEVHRVVGNRKGIFTRQRQPKLAAHFVRERWHKIPDFWEK